MEPGGNHLITPVAKLKNSKCTSEKSKRSCIERLNRWVALWTIGIPEHCSECKNVGVLWDLMPIKSISSCTSRPTLWKSSVFGTPPVTNAMFVMRRIESDSRFCTKYLRGIIRIDLMDYIEHRYRKLAFFDNQNELCFSQFPFDVSIVK